MAISQNKKSIYKSQLFLMYQQCKIKIGNKKIHKNVQRIKYDKSNKNVYDLYVKTI